MASSVVMAYSVTHDVTMSHSPMTTPVLDPLLAATRECVMDVGLKRTTLFYKIRRLGITRERNDGHGLTD